MRAVSPLPEADLRPDRATSVTVAVLRNILHGSPRHGTGVRHRMEFSWKGPARGQDQGSLVDR